MTANPDDFKPRWVHSVERSLAARLVALLLEPGLRSDQWRALLARQSIWGDLRLAVSAEGSRAPWQVIQGVRDGEVGDADAAYLLPDLSSQTDGSILPLTDLDHKLLVPAGWRLDVPERLSTELLDQVRTQAAGPAVVLPKSKGSPAFRLLGLSESQSLQAVDFTQVTVEGLLT